MRGVVAPLAGNYGIYHIFTLCGGSVGWLSDRRSKCLDWALCLVRTKTIAPGGVRVCAELRWGSFPREGFLSR